MDHQIIWSETATSDLRDVVRYIANDKHDAARKIGSTIIDKIESLIDNPYMGRKVPEKKNDLIRELILNPYRLIYQIEQNIKIILNLIEGIEGALRIVLPFWDKGNRNQEKEISLSPPLLVSLSFNSIKESFELGLTK